MRVVSVGSAVPEASIKNDVVEARLGLEHGWIERRTGILQRPTAGPKESTSDLAIRAGRSAIERSGIAPNEIGLLLLATSTPDHLLPPTAPLVAHHLGLAHAGAIDLAGACAGFLYAFILGASHVQSSGKAALIVGANVLSRRVNEDDPATSSLFSDGAGAVVLVPADPSRLLGSYFGSDGSGYDAIGIQAGGTREPLTHAALEERRHLMTIRRGSMFFRQAVHGMAEAGKEAMKAAGIDASAVDWWIPHQANKRIIEDAGEILGIPHERTINVIDRYANSSAATIPVALAHALAMNNVKDGNILLLTAVGAGMVSAGVVLRW